MPADRRVLALVQEWLDSSGEDQNAGVAELLDRLRLAISNVSSAGVITFAQVPIGTASSGIPNPIIQDLLFTDATYDIGKVGATRPRDLFLSRNARFAGVLIAGSGAVQLTDATGKIQALSATYLADLSGANLTTLNASNLSSGTVPDARFPATLPAASGVNLTALNATQLTTGTVAVARLPKFLAPLDTQDNNGSNSGTSETTMFTYSMPGGTLAVNHDRVRIRVWGTNAANANAKTFRVYFGATIVALKSAETAAGSIHWVMEAEIVRTGAATQIAIGGYDSVNTGKQVLTSSPAETLSGAITLKMTAQSGTGSFDINAFGWTVDFIPAP